MRLSALLLLLPALATAHSRSESYSTWHIEDLVTVTVTIPARELTRIPAAADEARSASQVFLQHLRDNVALSTEQGQCAEISATGLQASTGFVRAELAFDCSGANSIDVDWNPLFDFAPTHIHFARAYREGLLLQEALLTDSQRHARFAPAAALSSTPFGDYFRLGAQHIAGGVDHLVFLIGLLLLVRTWVAALLAITGFTIGHSISLSAAVLGTVSTVDWLVEAFIGFTIALLAVEYFASARNGKRLAAIAALACAAVGISAATIGQASLRQAAAYFGLSLFTYCYLLISKRFQENSARVLILGAGLFGLIHGFGFAAFLIDAGVAGESLLMPLLGFNLGVEAGQLMFVGALSIAGYAIRHRVPQQLPQWMAASLCCLGVFWFVSRSIQLS